MAKFRMSILGLTAAICAFTGTASASQDGYTKTQYPVVLVHGLAGFNKLFGVVDYFYGIPSDLKAGGAEVYTTQVSAVNSVEERGEQLLQQLRYVQAVSGAPKLNVIAHSQGGLDARYAMAVRPDLFASLTTVGSPHQGTSLCDFLSQHLTSSGFTRPAIALLVDALGSFLELFAGTREPQDAVGAMNSMSTAGMSAFNARYPAGLPVEECGDGPADWNGIPLFSWGGTRPKTNTLDPSDHLFGLSDKVYSAPNDGLVAQCSSHFGTVVRDDYKLNHADEINQVIGLTALFGQNPVAMFRTQANRLKNEGL